MLTSMWTDEVKVAAFQEAMVDLLLENPYDCEPDFGLE